MTSGTGENKPTLTPDDPSNFRLKVLAEGIEADPGTYMQAISRIDPLHLDTAPSDILPDTLQQATSHILEVFKEHDDREVTYDDGTESELRAQPSFQTLLAELRHSHAGTKKARGQEAVSNPGAERTRDRIRHTTLSHYIGRVAAYKQAHADTATNNEDMQSTG